MLCNMESFWHFYLKLFSHGDTKAAPVGVKFYIDAPNLSHLYQTLLL